MRAWSILLHDFYKAEHDPIKKANYFALYTKTKKDYSIQVCEAKKTSNIEHISQAANTCKAAWDLVNAHRKGSNAKPKPSLTPDEINTYFVQVADKIVADLPTSHTDPCEALRGISTERTFNVWERVNTSYILKIVNGFKESSSQDVHGISCTVLKGIIVTIIDPLTKLVNACLSKGVFLIA